MKVVGYMRTPDARKGTDNRVQHMGDQLGAIYAPRTAPVMCDLAIHHGYKESDALLYCKKNGIPCIITEIGVWHNPGEFTYGWGYNGLNNLAFVPEPPAEERPKPVLQPSKGYSEGVTTVFGQKPGDAALRGLDIDEWVKEQMLNFSKAEYRPHPITLADPTSIEPLEDCLARTSYAVTYTSTVGAQALIAGILTYAGHPGSYAYNITDREDWLHRLSYRMIDLDKPIPKDYILSGLEEATERAKAGIWDK